MKSDKASELRRAEALRRSGKAEKALEILRALELLLYRAGQPMTLVRFFGLSLGLTLGGAVLGLVLGYGVLPAVLGGLPFFLVRRKKTKRMRTFDEQFPAALGLFSRALRAGHSMSSALQMVGSEMQDPVGPEFALVSREISLGLSPAVAMANLQARMDAQDLPVFVTAVLVQLEAGGNLTETLDNLGEVVKVFDTCYEVRPPKCSETKALDPIVVPIAGTYTDCDRCLNCWKLTRCDDEEIVR